MNASLKFTTTMILALLVQGCGSGVPEPELFPISGRVSLQGKPLETGKIVFIPTQVGGGKAYHAEIQDGAFQGEVTQGEKNIQIISLRPTGEVIKGDHGKEFPVKESIIPKEYGEFSKVMFTVEAHAQNELNLEMK